MNYKNIYPTLVPYVEENRFFLITNKVSQGDLTIEHKGTDNMWGDVNTKPTQGKRFRVTRAEVMGVSVDYDDNNERRCTHPLLIPKADSERISVADGEVLEKVAVVVRQGTRQNSQEG